jgi:hypothetical protein
LDPETFGVSATYQAEEVRTEAERRAADLACDATYRAKLREREKEEEADEIPR